MCLYQKGLMNDQCLFSYHFGYFSSYLSNYKIKMIVGGMNMKRLWMIGFCLCVLVGCMSQFQLLEVEDVDKIEIILPAEEIDSKTKVITLENGDEVIKMMNIFQSGVIGRRIADRDLLLERSSYYLLYHDGEVIQMISFNGHDSLRVWRGIECFEVTYSGMSPYEFIEELNLLN